jgi:LmbE family N-acetylglucosaminyl deacetylase
VTPAHTQESEWAVWPVLEALPTLDEPSGQVVVISAHPDDEVLGAGGLLAALALTDHPRPHFVTVTDGEASHGSRPPWLDHDLGERRADELVEGLRALGYPAPRITRLRLPDSTLAAHGEELESRLRPVIRAADLVLCPARNDGHIDHESVGKVTVEICSGVVPVWEYPIWTWHWTKPGDDDALWESAARFPLSPYAVQHKRRALACFGSQTGPLPGDDSRIVILPPEVLEHFHRPYEVFFT